MTDNPDRTPDGIWDVVVIGGGPSGENAAQYAISGSDRTAVIVEAELVGGECSYWACMPSKALLRGVEVADLSEAVLGTQARPSPAAIQIILDRRDRFTHNRDDAGQIEWADGVGIDVVRGHARLAGVRKVEVTGSNGAVRLLEARHAVVLATGSTAAIPPIPGLRDALPWTSRDATNLVEIPRRVAIIGGGVVACEAATWLKGLGAEEVAIVVRCERLLSRQEPLAGKILADEFSDRGVDVRLSTEVQQVSRPDTRDTGIGRVHGGPVTVQTSGGRLEVDEVLVAAGRDPASDDIGVESVGLTTDGTDGYVRTDEHMCVLTTGQWLYAVGDINGRALLTHMGKYQARIAGTVIAARAEGRALSGPRYTDLADDRAVPGVIFSDPQVAYVGLTEAAATGLGIDVETVEFDLASVAGAHLLRDDYTGRAKLVLNRADDTVVGATFVGYDVAELLQSATIAIIGKVPVETLWHAVPAYPTVSEVWLRLLETLAARDRA